EHLIIFGSIMWRTGNSIFRWSKLVPLHPNSMLAVLSGPAQTNIGTGECRNDQKTPGPGSGIHSLASQTLVNPTSSAWWCGLNAVGADRGGDGTCWGGWGRVP